MTSQILVRLFEHNNWANDQIIQACATLNDEQLDAEPRSATKGSIRHTLLHLASAQQGYLSLLTLPVEARLDAPPTYADLQKAVRTRGEGLLALARNEPGAPGNQPETPLRTKDGYFVEAWVVMVQVINHATEHREQINSMLSALGVTPPDLDGWGYGDVTQALVPIPA